MPDREGHIDKDKYYVEHYCEDTATVSIEISDKDISRFEMQKPFFHEDNKIMQSLSNLQNFGVDYMDFGLHADWIAAEVPYCQLRSMKISFDELFKNIAKELLVIRRILTHKAHETG
ncbi:MAG: hypothetical protein GYA55_06725, partial [SAR324 cluster bacterium]|nr:hypothetical protein [SAR324 cluster bacterium]